ncbi:MAG: hypothetical protein AB1806_11960 [Acidobacteriota bacterium]
MLMRRVVGLTGAVLLLLLLPPGVGLDARRSSPTERLDDAAFWRLFSEFSEPGGYFQSDNLVSNERAFPSVLPGAITMTLSTPSASHRPLSGSRHP